MKEQQAKKQNAVDEILKLRATLNPLFLEAVRQQREALAPAIDRALRIQRELLEELRPEIRAALNDEAAAERLKDKFVGDLRARLADPGR